MLKAEDGALWNIREQDQIPPGEGRSRGQGGQRFEGLGEVVEPWIWVVLSWRGGCGDESLPSHGTEHCPSVALQPQPM